MIHSFIKKCHAFGGFLLGLAVFAIPFVFLVSRPGGPHGRIDMRLTLAELLFVSAVVFLLGKIKPRLALSPILLLVASLGLAILVSALACPARPALREAVQWILTFALGFGGVRFALRGGVIRLERLGLILSLAGAVSALLAFGQMASGVPGYFIRGGYVNAQGYGFFLTLCLPLMVWALLRVLRRTPRLALALASTGGFALALTIRDTGLLVAFSVALLFGLHPLLPRAWKWSQVPLLVVICFTHVFLHRDDFRRWITPYEASDLNATFIHNYYLTYPALGWGLAVHGKAPLTLYPPAAPVRWTQAPLPAPSFERSVLKQRWAEWLAALRVWSRHPITGVGPGNYQSSIGDGYAPLPKLNTAEPDTQNGWLVLGSSIGLFGFLALAAALQLGIRAGLAGNFDPQRLLPDRFLAASAAGVFIAGFFTPFTQAGVWISVAVLLALLDSALSPRIGLWVARIPVEPPRRLLNYAVLAMMLGALVLLVQQIGYRLANRHVYLWQEAERSLQLTKPMVIAQDSGASGGQMIAIARWAGAGWRNEAGGAAMYDFEVPEAGSYSLWTRVRWLDGCGNSFFLRVNGGPRQVFGNDAEFGHWHWLKAGGFRLAKGKNSIELANREDGVALDKLLLTGDPDFRPEGRWERAESSDMADTPLRGWTTAGKEVWLVSHARKHSGRLLSYRSTPDDAAMLLQDPLGENFHLDCRFLLADARGDLRLVMLHQDPKNFLCLDLNRYAASLRRFRNGQPEDLTSTTLDLALTVNTPFTLTMLFRNGVINAQLEGRPLVEHIDRRINTGQCGFASLHGGVLMQSFSLHPIEEIYYLYDAASATPETRGQPVIRAGGDQWSNIGIDLAMTSGTLPPLIKFNIDLPARRWLELRLERGSATFCSIRDGQVEERRTIQFATATPWPPARLALRSFDREMDLRLDGREAGRVVFASQSPLRGAVEIPATGVGRVEIKGLRRFYDGFGGCDGNNSASWEPCLGRWKVMHNAGEGIEDCLGQLDDGPALTLAGEPAWENYEPSCMLRSSGEGIMGLVYHYQDAMNYDVVRWTGAHSALPNAGRIELVHRRAGRETICAQAPIAYQNDQWYELRVALVPGGEVVQIDDRELLSAPPSDLKQGRIGLMCDRNPGTYFDNVRVDFF